MYSAALPSPLHHNIHPPFTMNPQSMHTPMQPFFNAQPPGAPSRPSHQNRSSMAQLTAVGISPNGMPIHPMGQGHFSHPSMILSAGPPVGQHFQPRSRRQPSIGGPPKAVLGGPGRKLSPLPPPVASSPSTASQRGKKVTVNLPKETINLDDGQPPARSPWARLPVRQDPALTQENATYPELITCESFPPDSWRYHIPDMIDVFLPGKVTNFILIALHLVDAFYPTIGCLDCNKAKGHRAEVGAVGS